MQRDEVVDILKNKLKFSSESIEKLDVFSEMLLLANKKRNLISKSTESVLWNRHILDSAQIIQFIDKNAVDISDFGSGAGFPGIVIAIYDEQKRFHVKLYEKSPVKRAFLKDVNTRLNLNMEILEAIEGYNLETDVIVCRAFKKLKNIINISCETLKKPHNIIILKGKNAQLEINSVSLNKNYSYKLVNSITDNDSKIILIEANKNEK